MGNQQYIFSSMLMSDLFGALGLVNYMSCFLPVQIQRMVISGNNDFKPDILKAKEVVSLLIDDESLKKKLEQAQDTKQDRIVKRKQAAAQKKVRHHCSCQLRKYYLIVNFHFIFHFM